MCNWPKWIWPGLVTTALLTALTGWFLSGPVQSDLASRSGEALKAAGLPWAGVNFSGRDAVLGGVAEDDAAAAGAAKTVLDTYGVRVVDNKAGLPAKADPFMFSAIKNADGITLKGNYTASKQHADFVAAVEKAMPGIAVKDEMTLASGRPEGFDELAAFGISQLVDVTGGEVSLSNLDYSIKGDPVDLPAYDKLKAALGEALPAAGALKAAELSVPALGAPYPFSAKIDGDTVNLEGYAPTEDVKASLETEAKGLFSGKTVNNLLKIAGGAPGGFAELAKFGLGQLKTLGNGAISLTDLNYSLSGTPADLATFEALTAQAKTLPAGAVAAAIDLAKPAEPAPAPAPAPEPAKPFSWSAVYEAGKLALSGDVNSAEEGKLASDLSAQRFVKSELANGQVVREGAPEGFGAAQSGLLKALSYLASGKAELTDKIAKLSGTAPSQAVADLALAKAKAGLPEGYQLETEFKVEEIAAAVAPAAAAEPYTWAATSDANGVTLSGSVLSGDVAKAVTDAASAALPGKTVTNTMTSRNPSPAGFASAQSALLKALGQLKEGSAGLTDMAATLAGVAENDAEKAAAEDAARTGMGEGYQLVSSVTVAAAPVPEPAAAPACIAEINALLASGEIRFRRARAEIDPASKPLLDQIDTALAGCPDLKVEIGGHTDADGTDEYNMNLSQARAESVVKMLTRSNAVANRLIAKGYGESQPIAPNDTLENKAKNRRTVFVPVQ